MLVKMTSYMTSNMVSVTADPVRLNLSSLWVTWSTICRGGKQTDVLFMDFSKAFDKVGHLGLLLKLEHYGIQGRTLN